MSASPRIHPKKTFSQSITCHWCKQGELEEGLVRSGSDELEPLVLWLDTSEKGQGPPLPPPIKYLCIPTRPPQAFLTLDSASSKPFCL